MKHLNFLALLVLFSAFSPGRLLAQGDQPDSKGTEFWIMFNANLGTPSLELFISSDVATSGTVSGPFTDIPFTTTPGDITTVDIPSSATVTSSDLVEEKGIHIVSEEEITVYGLNRVPFTTDAFLALPVNVLGSQYAITSQQYRFGQSQIGIVGTQNNTTVTINPTANSLGHPAGTPFSITLDEGESYQIQALTSGGVLSDFTGTVVTSDKPVAVFASQECANVPVNVTFCDHLVEQVPPATTWGQQFVTVPLATRLAGDIFRIVTVTPNTEVSVTGINGFSDNFTIGPGEFHEMDIPSDEYTAITATQPILVMQYSKGDESDPTITNGDPFMLLIPPYEQFLNDYTFTTLDNQFNLNFVNVIAPNSILGTISLDGSNIPAGDFTAIGASGFSAAQVPIDIGVHNMQASLPFGVFIYGFGNDDSYGYLGGQSFGEVAIVNEIDIDLDEAIPNGDEYCFEAVVTDENGDPVPGVRVDFDVDGANTAEGFAFTDENGIATFCYTPTNNGTDTITATVGVNSDSGTLEIANPVPTEIVLDPPTASVNVGEEICLTATFLDQFGDPVEGETIDFDLSGANTGSGSAPSDADGLVVFCYTPGSPGADVVTASSDGISDASNITVIGDDVEPVPTYLTSVPETTTVMVGEEVCITATLLDQLENPIEGAMIGVRIFGDNPDTDMLTTDADGMAVFCYTPTNPGEDEVEFNNGELYDTTTVMVQEELEPPTPTTLTVDPETAAVEPGEEVCITATLEDQYGDPLAGEMIDIEIEGANPVVSMSTTNADGQVIFCYFPENEGTDMLSFTLGGISAMAEITVEEEVVVEGGYFRAVGPGGVIIDPNLEDGDVIDANDWPKFNIEFIPDEPIGSTVLMLTGAMTRKQKENTAPYFLHGNRGGNINVRPFVAGSYNIMATTYAQPKWKGAPGPSFDVDFEVIQSSVVLEFQMWNDLGDLVVSPMQDGDVYVICEIPGDEFNIEAITVPEFVGSVRMVLSGPQNQARVENHNPYFLYANKKSTISGMENAMTLMPGMYTLVATPYNRKNGLGIAGTPLTIMFEVVSCEVPTVRNAADPGARLPSLDNVKEVPLNGDYSVQEIEGVTDSPEGLGLFSANSLQSDPQNLSVYPNPASGPFTVVLPELPEGAQAQLWITDLMGRSLDLSQYVGDGQQQIELNRRALNLPAGVYILNTRTEGEKVHAARIILKD